MGASKLVESVTTYCPHCHGTHIHLRTKRGLKCMYCRRYHDHEYPVKDASTKRKAQV